jgi:hypothetical protein
MGELECVCHLQESGTDPNCPRCLADIAGLSSQEEARELRHELAMIGIWCASKGAEREARIIAKTIDTIIALRAALDKKD